MKIGNLMQKFFMSNPKRAMWFLSTMPASFWEKQGKKKLLISFHEAAEKVPAYKDFLKKNGLKDHTKIKTIENFKEYVPITNKKQYFNRYRREQLLSAPIQEMYNFATTSGTTGEPVFWFRDKNQDWILPKYVRVVYQNCWEIDKKSTLWIVTYALGPWIAGELNTWLMKQVSLDDPKLQLTIATPGANLDHVLYCIKKLAEDYDQIVIAGYPSFIKLVINEGKNNGINWEKLSVKIQTGGEAVSDNWKSAVMCQLTDQKKPNSDSINTLLDVYGTADAGGIGFGSLLTNIIRKIASEDKKFCKQLFGEDYAPSIVQYNPSAYYIEMLNEDHIVLSSYSGVPLIRYDIEDVGGIVPYNKMLKALDDNGYDIQKLLTENNTPKSYKVWRLPFVYVYSRQQALSIASANVYPSQIEKIVLSAEQFNGYKLSKTEDEHGNSQFVIYLELKKNAKIENEKLLTLSEHYVLAILNHLKKVNTDFNQACIEDLATCLPIVKIYPFRDGPFAEDSNRTKPRLIV
ncbi:MAG: hypothetical protein Q7S37_04450 [bacterium]|nr:hypothetical protein [bacterium]